MKYYIPSSSEGTSLEIIDLIAINDVPFMISTSGAVNILYYLKSHMVFNFGFFFPKEITNYSISMFYLILIIVN